MENRQRNNARQQTICRKRLCNLEKKFKKNKIFYNEYKLQIANLLENDTPNPPGSARVTSNMVFTTLRRSSPQKGRVAVADIREMFLQVKIREEDRDSLRFLWRKMRTKSPGVQNELAHLWRFVLTMLRDIRKNKTHRSSPISIPTPR
ncbi:hypothetical protein EVAR_100076_1 [Eumeta japonica]|uniref:Uncharacterized protein n=1 Tax=Eumeta variegata TaxID=151549 RepID=A0A4C1Z009_EUMVA|nr:hypothetical protein EVAR_100076_1 [Eumeta japonica]